jgi:Protein kinase domain
MDAGPSPHPTPETLRAYGLGKLDDAATDVVSRHLAHCANCLRRVTELAPETFIGWLRDAKKKEVETSVPDSAAPGGSPTGAIKADDPIVDSSAPALTFSEGQIDATSDASSNPHDAGFQAGARVGYFGDYELLKVLGEGGMGIVYKAHQLSLNRPVALKMIKASRFPSDDDVRRFQNEAEAVARLDHPNIVPVFEVGRVEDQHYFTMRLVAGKSLEKRLTDYAADPGRAARLVAVVAGGSTTRISVASSTVT